MLNTLTLKQLKAVAKELNVDDNFPSLRGYSKLRKQQLIDLLTLILGEATQTELTCEVKLPVVVVTKTTTTTKKQAFLNAVNAAPAAPLRLKDDAKLDAKPTRSRHGNQHPVAPSKRQAPSPVLDRGVSSPRQQKLRDLVKQAAVRAALDTITVGALAYEMGHSLRGQLNKLENSGKFLGVI
jgi:hypothetical protein